MNKDDNMYTFHIRRNDFIIAMYATAAKTEKEAFDFAYKFAIKHYNTNIELVLKNVRPIKNSDFHLQKLPTV